MFKRPRQATQQSADICLVVEGTYPYYAGGVASWAHDLITRQSHLTFHVVVVLAPGTKTEMKYRLPPNVLSLTSIYLQQLPPGVSKMKDQDRFFEELEQLLLRFHEDAGMNDLSALVLLFGRRSEHLGARVLLDSPSAWNMIQSMYQRSFPGGSFLEYFWSWRSIFGGLFSLLLPEIPRARMYHALCTGFAGLFASRAVLETGCPGLLTEHGIYTNERRIELGVAHWFRELKRDDLSVTPTYFELRELWVRTFATYSRLCYQVCDRVVTLYSENQQIQRLEGADANRLRIIPNGVDYARFSGLAEKPRDGRPTIALIGRIVPIKGVKTFIMASQMIKEQIPDVRMLLLGPNDEDPAYVKECTALVEHLGLGDTVEFHGQVKLDDYLAVIDVLVLTSVSEAQPLVILEAGAAKVPCVATDVGACRELIMGTADESPALGCGGAITGVSDSRGVATEVLRLLKDPERRRKCGENLQKRVATYYTSEIQHDAYRNLYEEILRGGSRRAIGSARNLNEESVWPG